MLASRPRVSHPLTLNTAWDLQNRFVLRIKKENPMPTRTKNKKTTHGSDITKAHEKRKASASSENLKKGTGYARTEIEKADEERAGQ
jgi:hypothetical protein